LPFPEFDQDYEFVALRHPDEYAITEGRVVSSRGIDIAPDNYPEVFEEEHVEHSTSLHSRIRERGAYHVGPLARYNLNFDRLPLVAQEAALAAGLGENCRNPFRSIIVRAVELVFACHEALHLIDQYEKPPAPWVEAIPRAGTGHGVSEAPRGLLYHRYTLDADGLITSACIVPPTSQNQKIIEDDLRRFVEKNLHLPQDRLTWKCEQVIRNYDPCISCSCHFLRLEINRS